MNSHGIPSLKELYHGVTIDVDNSPNRHLQMAGLSGRKLYLEMVEDLDPADEEYEEEYEEEEEVENDEDYDPLGLSPESEEEEEDEDPWEVCDVYPDGCPTCEDQECWHELDAPIEDEQRDDRLLVMLIWPTLGGVPKEMSDDEIEANPALCRFLSQINRHNGL